MLIHKKNWFLFIFFLLFTTGWAQDCSLQELKEFYKIQDLEKPLELYSDSLSEIQQIILIRHGEPNLNKKGWRNRKEAIQFMQDYDSAIVKPFTKKPICLESIPNDTIYHSTLPRAENTARRAYGNTEFLVGKDEFVEFERKAMKWPNMKMPIKFWTTGSRILWMMGFNDKDIESFKEAKKRAESNAKTLSIKASQEGTVILVAHGLHNKYVKKYLKKSGWKKAYNSGNNYLSVKVMVKGLRKEKLKYKRSIYQPCGCT